MLSFPAARSLFMRSWWDVFRERFLNVAASQWSPNRLGHQVVNLAVAGSIPVHVSGGKPDTDRRASVTNEPTGDGCLLIGCWCFHAEFASRGESFES